MRSKKKYHINCIQSAYEKIINMQKQSKEITYKTFLKHIYTNDLMHLFPNYYWKPGKPNKNSCSLRLKDDFAVSFYKSYYGSSPCVYVVHSQTEYIFI